MGGYLRGEECGGYKQVGGYCRTFLKARLQQALHFALPGGPRQEPGSVRILLYTWLV